MSVNYPVPVIISNVERNIPAKLFTTCSVVLMILLMDRVMGPLGRGAKMLSIKNVGWGCDWSCERETKKISNIRWAMNLKAVEMAQAIKTWYSHWPHSSTYGPWSCLRHPNGRRSNCWMRRSQRCSRRRRSRRHRCCRRGSDPCRWNSCSGSIGLNLIWKALCARVNNVWAAPNCLLGRRHLVNTCGWPRWNFGCGDFHIWRSCEDFL